MLSIAVYAEEHRENALRAWWHYEAGKEMTFSGGISIFAAAVFHQFREVHVQIVEE